jgi:hypothetical protein
MFGLTDAKGTFNPGTIRPDKRLSRKGGKAISGEMKSLFYVTLLLPAGLGLFSGCASIMGETAGELVDDNTITAEANAIIVQDPEAHYLKIDVETTQGNVALTGFVNTKESREF